MKMITINLPENYLKDLDELVRAELYPNRAEAIRVAVRDLISEELWSNKGNRKLPRASMV
jgi:Arc/MetJ-type ribon-helix-helix transcriptional regulator